VKEVKWVDEHFTDDKLVSLFSSKTSSTPSVL